MSNAVHCDNPACDTWQIIAEYRSYPPHANWITVTSEGMAGELHFCSWRCVDAFAETKLPRSA